MLFYYNNQIVEHFRKKFQALKVVPTDETVPKQSISICTTCMNRLEDISRTLPCNIEDTKDYTPVEFVLLDYSSTDDLPRWVRHNMQSHMQSGLLKYCRIEGEPYFRPGHSRNVSFRLASGNIVVNVDADNFIHKGFIPRINQCLRQYGTMAVPRQFLQKDSSRLLLKGRFAFYREDLLSLGGFDESLDQGYGSDDVNLVFRAILRRFQMACFEDKYMADRLETSNEARTSLINTLGLTFEQSKARNEAITSRMLCRGITVANEGKHWGKATVVKNFSESLSV